MITKDWAQKFAQEWVEAWNAHDIERVLSHYTDDFEMNSPFIVEFAGEPSGMLNGKTQVRAYWQTALEHIPDLTFELLEVFTCVNSITIYYRHPRAKLAAEVFLVDEDEKVYKSLAHYN